MKRHLLSFVWLLLLCSCQQHPETLFVGDIPFVPMETESLPEMNTPRAGHALVWADDHILVVGGHTTGFVPTPTAEYYKNGKWHQIPTLYLHDTPFALVLKDGDVLIGGGYEKDFGVGQTWGVECYHPATHSFAPKSIMDRKRAHASALELEHGEIVISGNWYATDVTEIYIDSVEAQWIDTAADNRSYPFLLPVTNDNVWIIGGTYGSYGMSTQNVVDQTKGEPFSVDLLAAWLPQTPTDRNVQADAYRLAEHTFLIPAINAERQWAPMLVDSTGFSLLSMEQALPKEGPWGSIQYTGSFWTDPETGTAWLMGLDGQRVYLAEIAYQPALQGGKAKLAMHYTRPLEDLPSDPYELLLPDGSFVIVGGMNCSNFISSATVYAFYPNAQPQQNRVLFAMIIGLMVVTSLWLVFIVKKKKHQKETTHKVKEEEVSLQEKTDLGEKLKALMEEKQLFRNKDLRIADVAAALGTNTTYLSACLNGELNTTFPAFVIGYRVRYAQELMSKAPTMRLSQVAEQSGFTNEKTFLRTFKTVCGVTPSEWKQEHGGD